MISNLLQTDFSYALAWTLVHSIWQISILGLILNLYLKFSPIGNAQKRYLISFFTLCLGFIFSLMTFSIYYLNTNSIPGNSEIVSINLFQNQVFTSAIPIQSVFQKINAYIPVIVSAWVIGSMLFLLKFILEIGFIKVLIKKSIQCNEQFSSLLHKLQKGFDIQRNC